MDGMNNIFFFSLSESKDSECQKIQPAVNKMLFNLPKSPRNVPNGVLHANEQQNMIMLGRWAGGGSVGRWCVVELRTGREPTDVQGLHENSCKI